MHLHAHAHSCTRSLMHTHTHSSMYTHTHRAVQILPNQVLQEVGRHTDSYPIDCMRLSHDSQFLVTCSQDCCKFWAVPDIPRFAPNRIGTIIDEQDKEEEEEEKQWKRRKKRKRKFKQELSKEPTTSASDFFCDL